MAPGVRWAMSKRLGTLGPALGLIGAVALGGAGCGDDDDPSPAERFASRYADIYCAGMAPCCQAAGNPHEVDACRQLFGLFGYAAAQAKHFDSAAADQCLVELETTLATCDTREPEVCGRVFSGDRAPGQPCESEADCALPASGDTTCDYSFESGSDPSGICKVVLPAADGQPCGDTGSTTELHRCTEDPGFYCEHATNTCRARVPVGADCSSGQCAVDARCDSATLTCVALAPVGGKCSGSSDCVAEAFCDPSGTCFAKKAAGEACSGFDECSGFCDSDTGKCTGSGPTLCVTSD